MRRTIRRALLSVYDKQGLAEFARGLSDLGVELVSSASTAAALDAAGLPVTKVETVTGMPEMLDERVKTLHPKIHGGLLADRDKESHLADLERHDIEPFDLVVSNLYPFLERPGIDTIDIGGPAMVRASAKNHAWVTVVTNPNQYDALLEELRANDGTVSEATRRAFALEAFAHTSAYDAAIVQWLQADEELPQHLIVALERAEGELRYGENPHQQAARYRRRGVTSWWDAVQQHSGLALSYLNFYDTDAAWQLVHDLGTRSRVRDHQAREPVRSRARGRTRGCVPTCAGVRRTLGVRRHRRAQPADRRRDGRAHGRRSAGRRGHRTRLHRGCDRGVARQAQEHADPRSRSARSGGARLPPALRRVPRPTAARLRRGARRVAGRHQGRADRPSSGAISSSRGASVVT